MTEKNTLQRIIRPIALATAGLVTVTSLAACGAKEEPMMKDDKGGTTQEEKSSDMDKKDMDKGMDDKGSMTSDGGGMDGKKSDDMGMKDGKKSDDMGDGKK